MRTPTFGFPTRYRLTHPRQFRNLLGRAAYRDQSGPLRILANPNTMPSARLGLIVGKRAVAKAHERNRLKRVAREAFRLKRSELPALDIVLQVRGPIDSRTLRSKLEDMLNLIEEKLV